MLIRVEMGKGRKDRHAILSPQLLSLLRAWWLQSRSRGWPFPGRDPLLPIAVRQLNRVYRVAAEAAGLGSWVTPHTLRHYVPFLTMSGNSEAAADLIGNVGSSRAQVLPITQHSFARIQESNWRVS
jgi:integrase/recombinase XerD